MAVDYGCRYRGATACSWIFRYAIRSNCHEKGRGSVNTIDLAEARIKGRTRRQLLVDCKDPLAECNASSETDSDNSDQLDLGSAKNSNDLGSTISFCAVPLECPRFQHRDAISRRCFQAWRLFEGTDVPDPPIADIGPLGPVPDRHLQ